MPASTRQSQLLQIGQPAAASTASTVLPDAMEDPAVDEALPIDASETSPEENPAEEHSVVVFSRRAKKKMNLLYTVGEESDRPEFVSSFIELLAELGMAQHKVPLIDRASVDLFKLYKAVQSHGGFVEGQKSVSWLQIAESAGLADLTKNMLFTLKDSYIKLLLPYEARYDRGGVDPESLIEAGRIVAESPEYRERNRDKLLHVPAGSDGFKKKKKEPSPPRNELGWFICGACQAERGPDGTAPTFMHMENLRKHKHLKHGGPYNPTKHRFSCHEEGCSFTSRKPEQMVTHLGEVHRLPGFAITQEHFRTGKELHEWKLLKMEATNSALSNYSACSRFIGSIDGTLTHKEMCFRNPRWKPINPAPIKYPQHGARKAAIVDCPAFMKETCFPVDSLKPGSPRIQVQFCLMHYGHDPEDDVASVQRRLNYLKRQGPRLFDVDDSLPISSDDSLLGAENCAEVADSADQFSADTRETSGTVPVPGFKPIPLATSEVENSVDPNTGRLDGESVEIDRCHASIVLALKDIAASGAEETLKLLQDLEQRAVIARTEAVLSKNKADDELERRNALKKKRKRRRDTKENPKRRKRFLLGDGKRFRDSDSE